MIQSAASPPPAGQPAVPPSNQPRAFFNDLASDWYSKSEEGYFPCAFNSSALILILFFNSALHSAPVFFFFFFFFRMTV